MFTSTVNNLQVSANSHEKIKMDIMKKKLRRYKYQESMPFLYDVQGHITLYVKNFDSIEGMSFRQVVKSLPPVIIGHMIYQHGNWIDAGALMAEHLARKFVARALNWIDNIDPNSMGTKYDFNTHITGYSSQSFNSNEEQLILRGTSIAVWNEYPYRVNYEFHYTVSSTAQKNYKWLGYKNYDEYKLRDERFKEYIRAIVDSHSTQVFERMYDVNKAMEAVMFLVE